MTVTIALDLDHLAWLKAFLRRPSIAEDGRSPWRSSKLDEALAAAFGHRSHAALLSALATERIVEAPLDLDRFDERMEEARRPDFPYPEGYGGPRTDLIHGLCHLSMIHGKEFGSDAVTTRKLAELTDRIVWERPELAKIIAAYPPLGGKMSTMLRASFFNWDFFLRTVRPHEAMSLLIECYGHLTDRLPPSSPSPPSNPTPSIVRRAGLLGAPVHEVVAHLQKASDPILTADALALGEWLAEAIRLAPEVDQEQRPLLSACDDLSTLRFPRLARYAFHGLTTRNAGGPVHSSSFADLQIGLRKRRSLVSYMSAVDATALKLSLADPQPVLLMGNVQRRMPGCQLGRDGAKVLMTDFGRIGLDAEPRSDGGNALLNRSHSFSLQGHVSKSLGARRNRISVVLSPLVQQSDGTWDMTMLMEASSKRTGVDAFRARLAPAEADKGTAWSDLMRKEPRLDTVWAEGVVDVAVVLIQLARISSKVEGFPTNIPIRARGSKEPVFEADFVGGSWRVVATRDGLEKINDMGSGSAFQNLHADILAALDVYPSPEAIETLKETMVWGPEPMTELSMVADIVPKVSIRALLVHGSKALSQLGILKDRRQMADESMAIRMIQIAASVGIDVDGKGADERGNRWGYWPLVWAVRTEDVGFVDALLASRSTTRWDGHRFSPLGCAIEAGRTDLVRRLIEHGASVSTDEDGATPLHCLVGRMQGWALSNDYAEIMRLLLDAGADPWVRSQERSYADRKTDRRPMLASEMLEEFLLPDRWIREAMGTAAYHDKVDQAKAALELLRAAMADRPERENGAHKAGLASNRIEA